MNGFLKDITYARSGEYILSIYTRESCKDLWKNFGERPITFSIAKKADPRGLRANSYAWALIEQLAAKLKTDKESVYMENGSSRLVRPSLENRAVPWAAQSRLRLARWTNGTSGREDAHRYV